MKKKIICLILVFISFMQTVSFSSEIELKKEQISNKLVRNYNNDAVGELPSESVANGNILKVVQYPSENNRSLYFKGAGISGKEALTNASIYTCEPLVLSFKVQWINADGTNLKLTCVSNKNKRFNLVYFTDGGSLRSFDGKLIEIIGERDEFTHITCVVDVETGLVDIYIDGVKKASNLISSFKDMEDLGTIYLYLGTAGEGYIDDFEVYSGKIPKELASKWGYELLSTGTLSKTNGSFCTDEELVEFMKGSTAFFADKKSYYHNGEVCSLNYIPYTDNNGVGYLKAELANKLFGYVSTDNLVSVEELAKSIGKYVSFDGNGLVVIADKDNFFTYMEDMPMYRALCKRLVFENIPAKDMFALFEENHKNNEHPRIYASAERYENILKLSQINEYVKKNIDNTLASAENMLDDSTIKVKLTSEGNNLDTARTLLGYSETLGHAYLLTGDERFAKKLWSHFEAVATWDEGLCNSHMLTTGEYLAAIGYGYDAIYNWMDEEQRELLRNLIVEKGFKAAIEDFEDITPRQRSNYWARQNSTSNWYIVVDTGLLIAAMAIYEDEPDICQKIIDYSMEYIKNGIIGYAPDGAWEEGITYWNYATLYLRKFIDLMYSSFDTDFGYLDVPGLSKSVYYIIGLKGDNGMAPFGDGVQNTVITEQYMMFSNRYNLPEIQKYYMDNTNGNISLWDYRPEFDNNDVDMKLPLDLYFRYNEEYMMHSSYEPNSITAVLHSGNVSGGHSHYDVGNIIIDAYGSNFVFDLGSPNYSHRPVNYTYRRRTEGHNLYVINPSHHVGQIPGTNGKIDRYESNKSSSYAITDITAPYGNYAQSAVRGLKFTNNREALILQDEIELKESGDLYWFLHSECPIQVSPDGKSAIFKGRYKDMKATLISDVNAEFTVVPAKLLPSSGVPKQDIDDSKINKLQLHLENVDKTVISVAFTFQWPDMDESVNFNPVPLSEWALDEELQYDRPQLSDLKVDGATIEGFDPDINLYTKYYELGTEMPIIEAAGDGEVEIIYPKSDSGMAIIKLTSSSGITNTYGIKLVCKALRTLDNGAKELFVKKVEASSIPQIENGPDNLIDGDYSTRYSAEGQVYVVFDLGSKKTISDIAIALAFAGRTQQLTIYSSDDAISYEMVHSVTTSNKDVNLEHIKLKEFSGRYVKVELYAGGNWNSISELAIFGR